MSSWTFSHYFCAIKGHTSILSLSLVQFSRRRSICHGHWLSRANRNNRRQMESSVVAIGSGSLRGDVTEAEPQLPIGTLAGSYNELRHKGWTLQTHVPDGRTHMKSSPVS